MSIKKSSVNDVQAIMKLVHQAQLYFKNNGIDQWQDGYPKDENIYSDIDKGHSYVLFQNNIMATMYFAFEDDPCYKDIDGQWLTNNQTYAVIHRIVVDENYKGQNLAKQLLDFAIEQCLQNHIYSIRIDTHENNTAMQHLIDKMNFIKVGELHGIYRPDEISYVYENVRE